MVRTTVTREIIDHFRKSILSRKLRPGDRLPAEVELAAMLGVGRGTIRESLQVLIHSGLLERQQRATVVSPYALDRLRNRDLFERFGRHRDVMEMIELRKIIEPEAAALAAERVDAVGIGRIEEQLRLMVENRNDVESFIEHDNLFHVSLLRASGNHLIMEIIRSIQSPLRNSQSSILHASTAIAPRSIDFHGKIVDAVKDQNPRLAKKHMLDHIRDIEQELLKIAESDGK